ncbi:hypothetical protein B1F73_03725 [Pseudomonas syringae]|nr:hypothetical protein CCL14_00525 [Pseudomonas syringae]PBP52812.1 hypothetical protein CCL18_23820 [Pseudomonas syringae]PBP72252.1 hypothetical protein CCL19_08075 [Pseudomonas syringae]RXU02410.1 hypothetical protein B1F73_03725 [Pseudomonas syringae]RXU28984.1 hypothetical protein B0A92_01640 [Pseudomonas syringae]
MGLPWVTLCVTDACCAICTQVLWERACSRRGRYRLQKIGRSTHRLHEQCGPPREHRSRLTITPLPDESCADSATAAVRARVAGR